MKGSMWIICAASGLASSAMAQPEKLLSNGYRAFDGTYASIYYDVATGEMVRSTGAAGRSDGSPVWVNEDIDQCGFGEWKYYPTRDDAIGRNLEWMDWGDIAPNSVIDCMTFLYVTTVPDPEDDGEDGFDLVVSFLDGLDVGAFCGWHSYLTWELSGIPGAASNTAAWLITVDFSGTPENWFEIGDVNSIDDAGSGLNSFEGWDTDFDGGADFGYAIRFNHPALGGATGCALVAPPDRIEPNSLGTADVYATFAPDDYTNPDFYWFGGYDCSGGAGYNWRPWADYYMGLYRSNHDPNPCLADTNDDGLLDFFDVQIWLGWFSGGNPFADCNGDGVLDFFDVQCFLGQFSDGCP